MSSNISSISQALAGNAAFIPIANQHACDNVKMDEIRMAQSKTNTGLPTPPNSLSPITHPQSFRAKATREMAGSPPSQVESDIELEGSTTRHNRGATVLEEHGNITPAYLAKHHLPDLVLEQGPIAIRHLMNQLGSIVPGFSDIPPAKARRIVVGALESRRGGGVKGEVEFEKVGWGRWDAKLKGFASKEARATSVTKESHLSPRLNPDGFSAHSRALRIPGNGRIRSKSRRLSHGSWTAESAISSYSGRVDVDVIEDEADRMSIDGDEDMTERYPTARIGVQRRETEYFSDTDEGDWANIGAEAFRGSSLPASQYYSGASHRSRSRTAVRIKPRAGSSDQKYARHRRPIADAVPLDFTGVDADSQEREAIEALMRMGSM